MRKSIKALIPSIIKQRLSILLTIFTTKIVGQYVTGFLVQAEGLRYAVGSKDMSVGRSLRVFGRYADDEKKRIEKLITKDSTVIFIGTHIGAIAIPTAKKVKKALFIEANPNTFELLKVNVHLNQISNAKCLNLAIGEKPGVIPFVLNTNNSGGSKREPVFKDARYYQDAPETIQVPMNTLDNICSNYDQIIDLVFIDIEGSEVFALIGMPEVLKRTKALIIEFIPHHLRNVSGANVEEFLAPIAKNFNYCYVPSKNKYLKVDEFTNFFVGMFDRNESDDGLVFTVSAIEF